jgi:putative membrane protein
MAARSFFEDEARERVQAAVATVELATAAEIVVTVRRASGSYRHVDFLVGFLVSWVVLWALLFLPQAFPIESFPIDVIVGFGAGVLLSSATPALRRALCGRASLQQAAVQAAKAAFVDLGVSKTRDRTGILVYLSIFERELVLVPDVGVDVEAMGEDWTRAEGMLRTSLAEGPNLDRFVAQLEALAPTLGRHLPRRADDVNELHDGVHVA